MPPIFNLQMGSSGHSVRHGKTRSPQADFTTLLEMRGATEVHHEYARPSDRANVSHVRLSVWQQNLDFRESGVGRLSAARGALKLVGRRPPYQDEPPSRRGLPAPVAHVILCLIACRMRQRLLVIKHRAVIEDVEITTAQFAFEKVLSFIDGLSRISDCARKFLPFTPKWIGR